MNHRIPQRSSTAKAPFLRRQMARLSWGMALLLVGATCVWGQQPPEVSDAEGPALPDMAGLHLVMESEGLPGAIEASVEGDIARSLQKVWLTPTKLRLLDEKSRLAYLFRTGEEGKVEFWELSPDRTTYRVPRKHQQVQTGRDRLERQLVRNLKREFSGDELKRELRREHLRSDNSREVELRGPLEDGVRLGHPVKRYQVYENDRLVVDAWVTEAFDLKVPLFDFYKHVGAFSNEVLQELQKLSGVPLAATLVVITDTFNFKIRAEVLEATPMKLASDLFDLPKGAREVEPEGETITCENHECQNMVERAQPVGKFTYNGRSYYFCSNKCRADWKEWLTDVLRRREEASRGAPRENNKPSEGSGGR